MMLNCKQASKLVSQSLDRPLSWSERLQLKLHLFMCNPCRQFKRQLQMLRTAMQRIRNDIEHDCTIQLAPDVKNRILRELQSDKR